MSTSSENEREQAIEEAKQALGLLKEYGVSIHYTKREIFDDATFMATDDDDAAAKVYEQDYRFTDSEGDEIAYVYELGKDSKGDEFEIDLRADDQPFSWVAVSIVKQLAKLDLEDSTWPSQVIGLVNKAKAACKK
jgi:hypothetical protein